MASRAPITLAARREPTLDEQIEAAEAHLAALKAERAKPRSYRDFMSVRPPLPADLRPTVQPGALESEWDPKARAYRWVRRQDARQSGEVAGG